MTLALPKKPQSAPMAIDRVLPNSLEAEMAVLGAMLYSQESADKVMDRIADAESFYYAAHRLIFTEACALMEAFRAVDTVLLTQQLRDKNVLEEVGGAAYLTDLMVNVPVTAMVDQYVDVVLNKQMLRNLIQASHQAISRSFEEQDIPQEIIEQAAQAVQALAEGNVQGGFVPVPELVADTVRLIEQLMESHSALTGLSTGFRDIDRLTGGLHRQEMIVIAARPSMGKSALAMNIAEHVAIDLDKPVGVFSLEMSKEELMKRLISARAKIDLRKLSAGFGGKDVDMARLTAVATELMRSKLFIDDTPALSITQIKARAHRLKKNHDIELLIIDYMQLMKCPGKQSDSNRQVEVALISQGVKALAKELNIPVIVLCQLNRKPDEREGGRPKLSDLRESGQIEQDADIVALLIRPEVNEGNEKKREELRGQAQLIIAKQRNGPTGDVQLVFLREYTRFVDIANVDGSDYPSEQQENY